MSDFGLFDFAADPGPLESDDFFDDSPPEEESLLEPDSDFVLPESLEELDEPEESEPDSEDPLELPPLEERALEPVRESLR
ncbi:MAG: hypothetical protein WA966_15215 [Ornithinimicrobium sp.]